MFCPYSVSTLNLLGQPSVALLDKPMSQEPRLPFPKAPDSMLVLLELVDVPLNLSELLAIMNPPVVSHPLEQGEKNGLAGFAQTIVELFGQHLPVGTHSPLDCAPGP
jgi:hypothetical protein